MLQLQRCKCALDADDKEFSVGNVFLWFQSSGKKSPYKFETPQDRQYVRRKMEESMNEQKTKTKLERAHRKSLEDETEWNVRKEKEVLTNYVKSLKKIIEFEQKDMQEKIALEFLESLIPNTKTKLAIIDAQTKCIEKTNNKRNKTNLKPNSRSSTLIKRVIYTASICDHVNRNKLQRVFKTKINLDLYEDCANLNKKFYAGEITDLMKDWSLHPSPFDDPQIEKIIETWFYRDTVSFDNKGGNKITIRNKKTGEMETRIYRCMIYSRKENHLQFSQHEDFGIQVEKLCGTKIGVDKLNSKRPREVIWDKDISRSIDKYQYLVDENYAYARKRLKQRYDEEFAYKIFPNKSGREFVKNHVCRVPDGSWKDDKRESESFFNCLDGKCKSCNFYKLFCIGNSDDVVEDDIEGLQFDAGDPQNDLWEKSRDHPVSESIFSKNKIIFPEREEMFFFEYQKQIRVTKKTNKEYTIEVFQPVIVSAKDYWSKLEKLFILSKPHFWATDVQKKSMWLERHLIGHKKGTICTTYDYTQKFQKLDGCAQTQGGYRNPDYWSAESNVTTAFVQDVKFCWKAYIPKELYNLLELCYQMIVVPIYIRTCQILANITMTSKVE